jgi:anti-sigma factor RsiW
MIDCIEAEIRDALPDLIHGRLSKLDRATLSAHVESCAACRAELELLKEVRASAPLVPRMDVAAIVSALPKPMPSAADLLVAQRSQGRPLSHMRPVYKWMAAAALVVTGSLVFANVRRGPAVEAPVATPQVATSAVVVPDKSPEAVRAPASAAAPVVSVPAAKVVAPAPRVLALSLTTGVQDLTDDQLQTLLDDLDKVQGLPTVEPESVSIPIDDEGIQ